MAARKVAAMRGMRPRTNLTIPKGGQSPLPKVAGKLPVVRNDHKANRGGKSRGGKG